MKSVSKKGGVDQQEREQRQSVVEPLEYSDNSIMENETIENLSLLSERLEIGVDFWSEVRTQAALFANLAIPSSLINVGSQLQWVLSSSFGGRTLGSAALGALALSQLGNLAGKTFVLGLLSAYDTLAGKAFGEQNFEEIGLLTQRILFCLLIVCFFIFILFYNIEGFFRLVHQPENVIGEATEFLRVYAFVFPADAVLEALKGFYRCQNICIPFVYITWAGTFLHFFFLRALIKEYGFIGIAYSHALTQYGMLLLAFGYIRLCGKHKPHSWKGFDPRKALTLKKMKEFLDLGIPGIFSLSEFWFWELQTVLVGLLGTAALAAHSIAYNIVPILFYIPYGVGLAAQTRIATLIAEKQSDVAKKVAVFTLLCNSVIGLTSFLTTYSMKKTIISFFMDSSNANEAEVLQQVDKMWLIVSGYLVFDAVLGASMGVFRGVSLHGKLGVIMLFALWIFGVPVEIFLGFYTSLGLAGLWLGLWIIYCGMDITFILVILCRDWKSLPASSISYEKIPRDEKV